MERIVDKDERGRRKDKREGRREKGEGRGKTSEEEIWKNGVDRS